MVTETTTVVLEVGKVFKQDMKELLGQWTCLTSEWLLEDIQLSKLNPCILLYVIYPSVFLSVRLLGGLALLSCLWASFGHFSG